MVEVYCRLSDQCLVVVVFTDIIIFNLALVLVIVPRPTIISLFAIDDALVEELCHKEDDLDTADDGEPREESHRAPNETQLGLRLDLLVSLNFVKGCRVKVDLHQLQG